MKYISFFGLAAKPVLLFTIATWSLISLISCEGDRFLKEVEVDLENPSVDLVLESTIFRSDTLITVYFSKTQSILEENTASLISDATVELFLNEVSLGTLQEFSAVSWRSNEPGSIYQIAIDSAQIKAGDQVRIVATSPAGEQVSAIEQMPNAANVLSATYFNGRQTAGYYYSDHSIRVVVDDPASEENYYLFLGETRYTEVFQIGQNELDTINISERVDLEPGDEFTAGDFLDYPISSDKTYDGRQSNITLGTWWQPRSTTSGEESPLFLTVSTINKAGYNYDETLDVVIGTEGNPFAEPAILPSSIEGGRGVLRLINDATTVEASLE